MQTISHKMEASLIDSSGYNLPMAFNLLQRGFSHFVTKIVRSYRANLCILICGNEIPLKFA